MEVCEPGWYQSQSEETLWNNTGAKGTELKQCIIHQTCWHLRLLCSGKEFSLHKRDQRGFSDAQGTQWGKRGHKHKYSEASSSLRQSQRTLESKDAHCKKSLANSYLRWSQRTANTGALLFSVRSFTRHLPTAGYAIKAKKWSGDFQRLNHWCSTWSNHHNIVLLRWFIQCSMSCRWELTIFRWYYAKCTLKTCCNVKFVMQGILQKVQPATSQRHPMMIQQVSGKVGKWCYLSEQVDNTHYTIQLYQYISPTNPPKAQQQWDCGLDSRLISKSSR